MTSNPWHQLPPPQSPWRDRLQEAIRRTGPGIGVIALILLLVSFWGSDEGATSTAGEGDFNALARVESGPFAITVTEQAVLDAGQSVTISSDLPSNRAKLLYLATEGSLLAPGDVIARIDPAPFEQDLETLRSDIQEAEAVLMQAEAELALLRVENEDKFNKLNQQLGAARLKVGNLEGADIPTREALARRALQQAQADYQKARQQLVAEEQLLARDLSTRLDLEKARDQLQQKKVEVDIAERNLNTLRDTALPAELQQARMALEHSSQEVDNYRDIVLTQKLNKQQAEVMRHQGKLANHRQALARTEAQLAMTTLTAPVSGQLLYKELSIGNEKRKVQVGDSLWQHQGFAVIPDLSSLVAYSDIREQDIGKLRPGLAVKIYPEAYPDLALDGEVESIGTLVSGAGIAGNNHFRVRIALATTDPRLRPGMGARATIVAKRYEAVLRIPVEAVFYRGRETFSVLWRNGNPREVAVELGDSDGEYVIVESGLEAGQEVMLVYPDNLKP